MKTYNTLKLDQQNDVLHICLDRPEARNATSVEMMRELIDVADYLRSASDIDYVVTTHTGPVFSAGADVKEMRAICASDQVERDARLREVQRLGQEMIAKLESMTQIHIAQVTGSCYGAGTALALTADFRVMSDDAVLAFPESAAGTFLTWGCTPRLTQAVGALRAKEFILFNREITAEDAVRHNLVNSAHPRADVPGQVESIIEELRSLGPLAVKFTKQLVNASTGTPGAVIQVVEPDLVVQIAMTGQLAEGFGKVGR